MMLDEEEINPAVFKFFSSGKMDEEGTYYFE
jgi:hypothetical protein